MSAPSVRDTTSDDDLQIRPLQLQDFIGQSELTAKLAVSLAAAQKRGEALDHVLLSGPPGLGKTTLAAIIANEMGSKLHTASAPAITRPRDLARLLTLLEKRDVLFIDEIHRLGAACEEILYPALEDGFIEVIVGEGVTAQSIRLNLQEFTLVGATTRSGMLSAPLKDRFGLELKLDFYGTSELARIIERTARLYELQIHPDAVQMLAERSRMTPRIANRLVRRVRDYATVEHITSIEAPWLDDCLQQLGVDTMGLNQLDRKILRLLIERYQGRPAGVSTLAALVDEEERTLIEDHEPFMLRLGLIEKSPRGRVATTRACRHLNIPVPAEIRQRETDSSVQQYESNLFTDRD
ncbi:MAG: Holliday junction branch migration DNA helicase RuvB [Leptospiraceae bacterium]|nr:Holliday junction branch migration DNA helicase RuvB [Leptospiraceae bacterium]